MIRKAVIPVAGLGTRMRPLTAAVPKAMLPLPFGRRAAMPVVHWILADAAAAGVSEALVIVSPDQKVGIGDYLRAARQADLPRLPSSVDLLVQDEPRGFGDAVLQAEDFAENQPVCVLLGDHVYLAAPGERPCVAQVLETFAQHGPAAVIGVQAVGEEELSRVGVVRGEPLADPERGLFVCTAFREKPDIETARLHLRTQSLPGGAYLAHCGIYAFSPGIFACLRALSMSKRQASEIELADAQAMLLERRPRDYLLRRIEGRAMDTGSPGGYRDAFVAFARRVQ